MINLYSGILHTSNDIQCIIFRIIIYNHKFNVMIGLI